MLNNVLKYLPKAISSSFEQMDKNILTRINEIRIRRNKPIVIIIRNTSYFVDSLGNLYDHINCSILKCDSDVFDELFLTICDYSIYSNLNALIDGYITLDNGARVGVSSTAVCDEGIISSIKDVTSLNIRIPRNIKGCADKILDFLYINAFPSIIVAGAPNSGKTTMLRDICCSLSSGFNNHFRKIAIIDERNEFAGKSNAEYSIDTGINTDILTSFSKSKGIEIATRSLSPEMIICDEISTKEEVESIKYAFSSGVRFAVSMHAGSKEDLYNRPILIDLLLTGEFEYIVWLDSYTYNAEIIDRMDIIDEINRCNNSLIINNNDWHNAIK